MTALTEIKQSKLNETFVVSSPLFLITSEKKKKEKKKGLHVLTET